MNRKEIAVANNQPSKMLRFRSRIFMTAVFSLLFGLIIYQFFHVSVLENKKYQEMANDMHFGSIEIRAHRGSIYDSAGTPLAKSASVYRVFLDPKRFKEDMKDLQKRIDERNKEKAAGTYVPKTDKKTGEELNPLPASAETFRLEAVTTLAIKLGITEEEITKAMEADNRYSVLQEQVEKPVADEVLSLFNKYGLVSLAVEEDTKRYYPQDDLAATVIGFTTSDGNGAYGLESSYNKYLSGTNGKTISAKDSNGNELPYKYSKTYPAKNGCDVYLTMDMTIQYYLEKHLEEMVTKFGVKNRGCAILMNCKTGFIYAMATYPSFDLNKPYEIADSNAAAEIAQLTGDEAKKAKSAAREAQWKNKCIGEIYEPGSVFKVFTSSAAIEEGLIDLQNDTFFCSGSRPIPGAPKPISCHKTIGHGSQDFYLALTNSCNPAFMEIGDRLGVDKFMYYFESFGLTEKTGIDLPGEAKGITFTKDTMKYIDLMTSSFGQGNTLTPIQMVTGCAAVVNGGYLLQPYVVDRVVDEDGNVVLKNERTVRRQVVSEDTSKKMCDALEKVVSGNGKGNVSIKGYQIGGKSGTAQRLSLTGPDHDEYAASYVCFTPADDPELVLLVMADMPTTENENYYGSKVAVPTAREIFTDVLPYLGYCPEYSADEIPYLDIKVPSLEGSVADAKATLEGLGIACKVMGEGTTVCGQSPQAGTAISYDGTVYLYTEDASDTKYARVPNLIGVSAKAANESIAYRHLNYVSTGASASRDGAVVVSQSIEPDSEVPYGTVVELVFEVNELSD